MVASRRHDRARVGGRFFADPQETEYEFCSSCGEDTVSALVLSGIERRCSAVALLHRSVAPAEGIRSGRKAMGLRQYELAAVLGVTTDEVLMWESGFADVPRSMQLAMVGWLLGLDLPSTAIGPEGRDG